MYVYYKDKNDTIGFVELKSRMLSYRFEKPVFVFHFELDALEMGIERGQEKAVKYFVQGLNPYERAYVSDKLNYDFEIQDHMYSIKTISRVLI